MSKKIKPKQTRFKKMLHNTDAQKRFNLLIDNSIRQNPKKKGNKTALISAKSH